MTLAVARVWQDGPREQRVLLGTGFAVSREFGLTAFHCVGDPDTGNVVWKKVCLEFPNNVELKAKYEGGDNGADFAVLRFLKPLPLGLLALRLATTAVDGAFWKSFGYAPALDRIGVIDIPSIDGHVSNNQSSLNGAPVIQLHCNQAAAKEALSLHGMSGAPVLTGDPQAAVGLIRWNPERGNDPERLAVGAIVFACPMRSVVQRFPALESYVTEPISRGAPSSDAPRVRHPWPKEQAPAEYVDRPELTQQLLDHLLEDQAVAGRANISVVHGLGGIGKTTIALWLLWHSEIRERFRDGRIWVTLGNEPRARVTIVNECVRKLDPAHKDILPEDEASDILSNLLQDQSVFFVIDDVWPGESAKAARALLVPSPRSHFLLTTRSSHPADDLGIRAKPFPLNEMNFDQAEALISLVLERELKPDERCPVQKLFRVLGGHPFALKLAAKRVTRGRSWNKLLTDLSAEIADLTKLEEEDQKSEKEDDDSADRAREKEKSVRASLMLSVRDLPRDRQRLFAWLGAISEDAIITPRMAATVWNADEETALRQLRRLSGVGILTAEGRKAEDNAYSIHDLMHALAQEILTGSVTPAKQRDLPGLGVSLPEASRQLLERYRAKSSDGLWHTLPDDGYIHDHLVQHFGRAGRKSELEGLLWEESADGHSGWYWARERLEQTSGFIGDLNRIWSYADGAITAAETHDGRARAIGLQLHCGLIITSINSLSKVIPTEVLLGSVRCGLIKPTTALTLARQNPDRNARASTLSTLASEMPPEVHPGVLAEALDAARGIDDPSVRGAALSLVASRLPPEEALEKARSIDYAWSRAEALAAVASRLPPDQAVEIARGIDDARMRVEALAAVASRLPVEVQSVVFGEALSAARSIDYAGSRAGALAAVASRLPPDQALEIARGIDDARTRVEALAAVAPRLPVEAQPVVLGEALSVARSIDDTFWRPRVLAAVASRLPPDQALEIARGIDDLRERVEALAAVASRLPEEAQPVVLGEALIAARSIDSAWSRSEALARIAPRLPAAAQPGVIDEAVGVARSIDGAGGRAHALETVAARLPAEAALVIARGIGDTEVRARALAAVGARLPAAEQQTVFSEALSAARSIDDAGSSAQALMAVAARLQPEEALVVARGIDDSGWRTRALMTIAPRLSVEEALTASRSETETKASALSRARALAAVAAQLPAAARPSVLGEALSTLREGGRPGDVYDASSRDETLTVVAAGLPPEEALVIARSIDGARWRAQALAAVAPRLPAEAQPSILRDALAVASSINDADSRAQALKTVAVQLPEEVLAITPSIDDTFGRNSTLSVVARWLPPAEGLAVARNIDDALWRVRALLAVAPRLPAKKQPSVLGEALVVARSIDNEGWRDHALSEVAAQLPPEEALETARSIDNAASRAEALASIATLLPPVEGLSVARSIDVLRWRAMALAAIASRLPPEAQPSVVEEVLSTLRGIDDEDWRARPLATVASLFCKGQITDSSLRQWTETVRELATRTRRGCFADFAAMLPMIEAIGGEEAMRILARSINTVSRWWP
jgi:hypothetical protein